MLMPLDQLTSHLSRPDQSLMYHMILQQMETNRLLSLFIPPQPEKKEAENIDDLKRQELMKKIAKLDNKPQGWNRWDTEAMRKHLKGAS